jgi:3-isopropylmalate/(R)-2-methylmalate dehydratase large subunit
VILVGQTISEKILAAHCGKDSVKPGDFVNIGLDLILAHDVTTPPAINELLKIGRDEVFDAGRIVVTPDHFVPNKDEKSATLAKILRDWAKRHAIKKYFEVGRHGICHTLLIEEGFVKPGMALVCGDSHTTTHGAVGAFGYGVGSTELAASIVTGKIWLIVPESIKVDINGRLPKGVFAKDVILKVISQTGVAGATDKIMEFAGKTVEAMPIESRSTLTNMSIEAGATAGIVNPDKTTIEYVKERAKEKLVPLVSDKDASFEKTLEFDVSCLEPLVAVPALPSNGKPAAEIEKQNIKIDQAVIGSCTNGKLEDLRIAAKILKGNKVHRDVRMIVIPATTRIWKQAMKEGLFEIFSEADAAISTPTCGPCLGGHMGVLADGERAISSTNRNFIGRMGSKKSEVFIASPATVAASAIEGKIVDPRKYF